MNNILAQVVTGKVIDENDKDYYVQIEGETFLLDKTEVKKPLKIGATFTGFTYENEQHKMQITRNIPDIRRDHYGFATVVKENLAWVFLSTSGFPTRCCGFN